MNKLILLVSIALLINCSSEQGVFFENLSFQKALEKAQQINKPILIDVFSDGWGGCRALDRVVFQNKTVGTFINEHFLSLRLNAKNDDGKDLVKHYQVNGFPTVLFLTNQGNEIDRICGFDGNKDHYLKIIQDYAAVRNTFKDLKEKYNRDTSNIVSSYRLAKKYIDRWESSKAQKYLNAVLKLDVEDNYGFREESELQIAIYAAAYSNKKDVQPLITFLNKSQREEFLKSGYNQLSRFYRNEKDTIQYFKTLDRALKKIKDNTQLMNEYAWAIFTCKLQDKYKYGIELAEKAVELEPEAANIWDTLAWLYYADGDHQKAISAMKKAVEINSKYHENLQKLTAEINKKI